MLALVNTGGHEYTRFGRELYRCLENGIYRVVTEFKHESGGATFANLQTGLEIALDASALAAIIFMKM